jgi:RimJ/RimL family protein N-acetyltransferase
LHRYLSDPYVVRFEPNDVFSPEEARREAERRAQSEAFVTVRRKEADEPIGNLNIARRGEGQFELGYVFARDAWGKGYATEAATAALNMLFETDGAHRVFAERNPQNTASERVMQRLGMRHEGTLRQNVFFHRDKATGEPQWQDTLVYAILREGWLARRAAE